MTWRVRADALRVPRAALVCALVALLNGLAWSMLIPPFHVPDENAHVAYVQHVAETGKLPIPNPVNPDQFSPEEQATLDALRFSAVIGRPDNRPPITRSENAALQAVARSDPSRVGVSAGSATNNPPLYYLLQAVPYRLSASGSLLTRVALMRVVSALLSAGTILVVFLFLRELLPGSPWVWSIGALIAAFQPTFGFVSGGVNSDDLLFLAAALTLWGIARVFRRELDLRTGLTLGLAAAIGLLTKPAYLGMVPGVMLTLLLGLRLDPRLRRLTFLGAGGALGVGFLAVVGYWALLHTVWAGAATDIGNPSVSRGAVQGSRREELSFIWQLFLPRLPFLTDLIPGFPLRDTWLVGFTGHFGWLDYGYPNWVYDWSWETLLAIGTLGVLGLVRLRDAVRRRWVELAIYLVVVAGVLGAIGVADWSAFLSGGPRFEQGRYLLPLLCLYAGLIAVALRALGRRLGPVIGGVLVVAVIGQSVFAQLLTLSRFYG